MNMKDILGMVGLAFGVVFCITQSAMSVPVEAQDGVTANAMDFLESYGYIQKPDTRLGKLLSSSDVTAGIKQMQAFAGLPETGVMDAATSVLMNTTRCGMPDVGRSDSARRKRRYATQGSKWNKQELTWRIKNYGNDNLNRHLVRATFASSLKKWSDVTNLSFKEITTGEPDIWFKFARGAHGDPFPFRLPRSSVLAHAFYPMNSKHPLAGDVHFNDDKKFSIIGGEGIDLKWVTVHELGHSLGLDHSKIHGAVMYPYYQDSKGLDFDLTPDDVRGVQTLYGGKSIVPPPVATVSPQLKECFSKVGAVFLGNDKKTYVFNSDKLFILKKGLGIEKGPIPVSKIFKGVQKVDATFKRQREQDTVLFSGKNFFIFDGNNNYISGPTPISSMFLGLPSGLGEIDAAFVWPGNNLFYIFKGEKYWRMYRRGKNYQASRNDYPRKISKAWLGVPDDVDAVFAWSNKATYFFKDSKFYRLSPDITVEEGYPKDTTRAWARISSCPKVDSIVGGEKSAASKSIVEVTLVTIAMAVASLLHCV